LGAADVRPFVAGLYLPTGLNPRRLEELAALDALLRVWL
jgi:hypothetical protein